MSEAPRRRVEDKIRSLCTQVQAAKEDGEVTPLLIELRPALDQYIEQRRASLTVYPFGVERRNPDGIEMPVKPNGRKNNSGTAA